MSMKKCAQVVLTLILVVCAPLADGPVLSAQQAPPGGMALLPGYTHLRRGGLDRDAGRITGPRVVITYDIGFNAGNRARHYAENSSRAWSFTVQGVHGEPATVTVDEPANSVIVTIGGDMNFEASHVESKRDLAEVLAMVLTYDKAKHLGLKK